MNPTSQSNGGSLMMPARAAAAARFSLRAASLASAGALLVGAAPALATTSAISGKVSPDHGPPGTPLSVTIAFSLDPAPGQSSTLSRAVLQFPRSAVPNGRLFPSCTAAQINARRGRFTDCPRGSKIGSGTLRADVPAADVFNVPAVVTIFNGPGGRSLTVHIYGTNPVLVSEAIDTPLTRTAGRYGYALTAPVPHSLQEISDGWFVELRRFTVTVGATIRDRRSGRVRGYVEARRCPRDGAAPIAGTFEFLRESAPTTALGSISCRP